MQKYQYQGKIGSGAFGQVWKCRDSLTGTDVAIKRIESVGSDPQAKANVIHELCMLRHAQHKNVVKLLGAYLGRTGHAYIVTDLCDRPLSRDLLHNHLGLPAARVKVVAWQLLTALQHLHAQQVVHGDIKPANILVNGAASVKLCDFGSASCAPLEQSSHVLAEARASSGSSAAASRWYSAPEALLGEQASTAADVWSFGCVLAELALGKPLIPGEDNIDQLRHIVRITGVLGPRQEAVVQLLPEEQRAHVMMYAAQEPTLNSLPRIPAELRDLLKALLTPDPETRATAEQALQMPYFEDLRRAYAASAAAAAGTAATPAATQQRLQASCLNSSTTAGSCSPAEPGSAIPKSSSADSLSSAGLGRVSLTGRLEVALSATTVSANTSLAGSSVQQPSLVPLAPRQVAPRARVSALTARMRQSSPLEDDGDYQDLTVEVDAIMAAFEVQQQANARAEAEAVAAVAACNTTPDDMDVCTPSPNDAALAQPALEHASSVPASAAQVDSCGRPIMMHHERLGSDAAAMDVCKPPSPQPISPFNATPSGLSVTPLMAGGVPMLGMSVGVGIVTDPSACPIARAASAFNAPAAVGPGALNLGPSGAQTSLLTAGMRPLSDDKNWVSAWVQSSVAAHVGGAAAAPSMTALSPAPAATPAVAIASAAAPQTITPAQTAPVVAAATPMSVPTPTLTDAMPVPSGQQAQSPCGLGAGAEPEVGATCSSQRRGLLARAARQRRHAATPAHHQQHVSSSLGSTRLSSLALTDSLNARRGHVRRQGKASPGPLQHGPSTPSASLGTAADGGLAAELDAAVADVMRSRGSLGTEAHDTSVPVAVPGCVGSFDSGAGAAAGHGEDDDDVLRPLRSSFHMRHLPAHHHHHHFPPHGQQYHGFASGSQLREAILHRSASQQSLPGSSSSVGGSAAATGGFLSKEVAGSGHGADSVLGSPSAIKRRRQGAAVSHSGDVQHPRGVPVPLGRNASNPRPINGAGGRVTSRYGACMHTLASVAGCSDSAGQDGGLLGHSACSDVSATASDQLQVQVHGHAGLMAAANNKQSLVQSSLGLGASLL